MNTLYDYFKLGSKDCKSQFSFIGETNHILYKDNAKIIHFEFSLHRKSIPVTQGIISSV